MTDARNQPPPASTHPAELTSTGWSGPGTPASGGRARSPGFGGPLRGGKGAQSSLELLPVPEQYRWSPPQGPGRSTNVAQAYARFARDYREGMHLCPTFEDAVTRHRRLNAIETSAASGQRQTLG